MMNTTVMFSSKTDDWATPQDFFDDLNREFEFTLDPCADYLNHKCSKFYTKEQNGLVQDWGGGSVFSVIPLTAKELRVGYRKPLKKVQSPIR